VAATLEILMTIDLTCDVCQKNKAAGVASSSLGACSFAYCHECLNQNADHVVMFQVLADMVEGDITKLRPEVHDMKIYENGNYVPFSDWIKTYTPTPYEDEAPHA
jgi:hypothetical protein